VSGGHFNPAVTLAVLVRGRIDIKQAIGHFFGQLVGALVAAAALQAVLRGRPQKGLSFSGADIASALVAECIMTFALAYVVVNAATSKDNSNNSFYGLAIGFTLLAAVVAIGRVTGAAINPAVALGGSVWGLFSWSALWIYWVAEFVGGALAGYLFLALNPDDK
jgi:aquaporin Z